jgi:hypothetical protein
MFLADMGTEKGTRDVANAIGALENFGEDYWTWGR